MRAALCWTEVRRLTAAFDAALARRDAEAATAAGAGTGRHAACVVGGHVPV